ncbi:MAG: 2-C-methyl-D-erythritol 4-phosphate cytidylyltransferase [Proteobacteria bacterium]|nr:MAG: 2-C-methyl-D-erythritol 4-phosphate cytidylyltransferase [Pseudomonadota bacterium]
MSKCSVWAVVPAAGKGLRMGADIPKQYLHIAGKPVLQHTLEIFVGHSQIAGVAVVIAADDRLWATLDGVLTRKLRVTTGGRERCHSVLAGIDALSEDANDRDWVMVHDAARPCLRGADIDRMIDELKTSPWGGILAIPVRDTLKRCNDAGEIEQTIDRAPLWRALTPQMFRLGLLRDAITAALAQDLFVTDEAQAIEAAGGIPRVVEGHADNIKITCPADVQLAEIYLRAQGRG